MSIPAPLAAELQELEYRRDAAPIFKVLSKLRSPFWLDSSRSVATGVGGRYDIMSAEPSALLQTIGDITRITSSSGSVIETSNDDPYRLLQQQLDKHSGPKSDALLAHLPFSGGVCGYWGYELGAPSSTARDDIPDMQVGVYHWSIVFDHLEAKAWLAFSESCAQHLRQKIRVCLDLVGSSLDSGSFSVEPFLPKSDISHYQKSIEKIQDYIFAGDCYQVNYAQKFTATYHGDLLRAFCHLREQLPSPYSAYIPLGEGAILSFSPERFMHVDDGIVSTKPIKGTAARRANPVADTLAAKRLLASEKDRAENLMIVDLLRNDLGRVCRYGSVSVPALFELNSYANVHHLVSTVTAELKPNANCTDLFRASFPGGSITGAPKVRAMEIITELESEPRSAYCGSIGYIGFNGGMDTSIAIRTMVATADKLHCWGGGGIVADSEALLEYQESLDKIGVLMQALEARFGEA